MANYNSLEDMMGNRENMECLVNNSRHDDDVMQFVGVDWFKFNNTLISNIFVRFFISISLIVSTPYMKPLFALSSLPLVSLL